MKVIIRERPGPWFVGLWCSKLCSCMPDGYIVRYINSLHSSTKFAIPWSDGFYYVSEEKTSKHEFEGYESDIVLGIQASLVLKLDHGILNNFVCLPLDDNIFEFGLQKVLEEQIPNLYLPWKQRKPIAFWRGAGPQPLRQKVVEELFCYEHADVLYGRIPGNSEEQWSQKWWDKTYEGKWQPIELEEFVKHKYILIIDNCIITSSYTWVFGSGSVPILVIHPLNNFWFKEFLIPWVNYVPVTHPDFGELNIKQTIQFLIVHDDIAEQIAKNALELSYRIFNPTFQREYIKSRLHASEA